MAAGDRTRDRFDQDGPPEWVRDILAGIKDLANQKPAEDPTRNVYAVVAAESKRQDELRVSEMRRVEDLRAQSSRFNAEVREIELRAQRDLAAMEGKWRDTAFVAESRRLDAIWASQQANVALASEKQAAQAATLAASVVATAEAMRAQTATLAATVSTQIEGLRGLIEALRLRVETVQSQRGGSEYQQASGRSNNERAISIGIAAVAVLFAVFSYLSRPLPTVSTPPAAVASASAQPPVIINIGPTATPTSTK